MNGQQRRSTWLIENRCPRITVAGQRLNFTDFAIEPSQLGFLAPLPNSIVKLQSNLDGNYSNNKYLFCQMNYFFKNFKSQIKSVTLGNR